MEKPITLLLWKTYTPEELQEKGSELSGAVLEFQDVEIKKKETVDRFKTDLDGIEGRIARLASDIRAKGCDVSVACVERYHVPRTAFKQVVRKDTGELVREEQMTARECQENLFETKEIDELKKMFDGNQKPEAGGTTDRA